MMIPFCKRKQFPEIAAVKRQSQWTLEFQLASPKL